MYKGYVTFAFNPDGYGEYTYGFIADVEVDKAENADEALAEVGRIAKEYVEEQDFELPYPWNWGDIASEVPSEFFAEHGCKFEHVGATEVVFHDEVVVSD